MNRNGLLLAVSLLPLISNACQQDSTRIAALEREVARLRTQQATAQEHSSQAVPADVWRSCRGGAMLTIDGNALFYSGQAKLMESAPKILAQVASDLRARFQNKDVYVFGHTDADPIKRTAWLDNRELSAARAIAIVRVLESHGIPSSRLIASGCGEHRPVAPNDSAENKSRNRRIEIAAVDPLDPGQ